jgi:outer membrane protein OmpA-like peptidoglycan-associated protein
VRAQVRRDFVTDVGATIMSIGFGWWPKTRAAPVAGEHVRVRTTEPATAAVVTSGPRTVSGTPITAPLDTRSYDDLVLALNHLNRENRLIRAELDSMRRALAALTVRPIAPDREPRDVAQASAAASVATIDRGAELREALSSLVGIDGLERKGGQYTLHLGVQFPTSRSDLTLDAREQLRRVAAVMLQFPETTIEVQGHTDSSGSAETNLRLSEERAAAVRGEILRLGIPSGRVTAAGYGSAMPIADNATRDGRARNRRVDLVVAISRSGQ